MSISEITKKVKASTSTRSPEDRLKLLKAARILNKQGKLDTNYFTTTIALAKASATTPKRPAK